MTLGKEYLKKNKKKIFVEGLTTGTRQRLTQVAAVTDPAIFGEGQALDKYLFCRGPFLCRGLLRLALGK
jgi:hypothetical protein